MSRNKALLIMYILGFGLTTEGKAGAISADGALSDWGLFAKAGNSQTWTPQGNQNGGGDYSHNGLTIYYTIEDYIGGNGGYIGPGYGGQAYDAEALYVTLDAANLYIALVTGHDPNTRQAGNDYAAGDFALNFWNDGQDDGTYEFGIRTPHLESQNGNIVNQFQAYVYETTNANWKTDPLWSTGAVTSLNTTGLTPLNKKATMSIQQGPDNIGNGPGPHWIYEISVAKSIFGEAFRKNNHLDISWSMNCANDIILVEDDLPVNLNEPPVWALLGLTLPILFRRRRRSLET